MGIQPRPKGEPPKDIAKANDAIGGLEGLFGFVTKITGDAVVPAHHRVHHPAGFQAGLHLGALVRHVVGVQKRDTTSSEIETDGNLTPLPDPFVVTIIDDVDASGRKCVRLAHEGSALEARDAEIDRRILAALARAQPGGLNAEALQKEVTGNSERKRARRDQLLDCGRIVKLGARYHLAAVPPPVPGSESLREIAARAVQP